MNCGYEIIISVHLLGQSKEIINLKHTIVEHHVNNRICYNM